MLKKIIQTGKAPAAIGPYSQGIEAGGFIFTSGQIPLTPDGQMVEGDIQTKARACLDNIRAVLQAQGADMADLVKVTVFVTDMADFQAVNTVYEEYFKGQTPPARSFVQAAALPKNVPIEIEAVAYVSE